MLRFRRSVLLAVLLVPFLQLLAFGDDANAPPPIPELAVADQLYRAGKFAEAQASYQALLKRNSGLVAAQVGMVRSMLRQQKTDEALDAVNVALAAQSNSAALLAAKGEIQFRRADMPGAELSFLKAKKLDPKEGHPYLGLARLYRSYSLYRKAYDQLQIAHEIAPDDIEVKKSWLATLPRKERVAALEEYLAASHPDSEEETIKLMEYLEFLRATADKPVHTCSLVSKVEQTETGLETMYTNRRVRGVGLSVKFNDRKALLLLDTGAGGIMVSRRVAEKAGLTRISAVRYGGLGDRGMQNGYSAVADHIRIGELEFQDCVVTVSEKASVTEEDGLIGADVLGSYLIDIDLPGMRLKLSPLPKRPEDTEIPKSLNSEAEDQAHAEQKEEGSTQKSMQEQKPSAPAPSTTRGLPKDSYVAPEMADWIKVFRFGHDILIPTTVNDLRTVLFVLDTGAFSNLLSLSAGRQLGDVSADNRVHVRGLNGEVDKVYRTDKVSLRFGRFQQQNISVTTIDLAPTSRRIGTEISGFLGFDLLQQLEVELDYRDGLVNFKYDPKHKH